MKIAVIDDYQDAFRKTQCARKLSAHEIVTYTSSEKDPVKFGARAEGCEAIVLTQQRSFLPRAFVQALPASVKLLAQTGRGAAHIDLAACTERGIIVSASGGGNSSATAELTWALILASVRNLHTEINNMQQGRWQTTAGIGIQGKTLGVYAFGKIGAIVARVGQAFGMRVMCWGREGSTTRAREAGFEVAASREAFFAKADIVTIHLPLNKDTRGLITAADLAQMKPTSRLVNTSRAPLIAEGALVDALKKGRPGFAAIDVYESEPVLNREHPLVSMPNVICTPHLGYVTWETYELYYSEVVNNILAYLTGTPAHVMNPEVLKKQ
ncbi:MAG: D-2-hydroxyacid dehydrogenase family protein [Betaproteobacteria bacterium]|nr:D-2-hydroxyacid dehydrogenase family protein [Betaproteobacteria bacterium]